MSKSITAVIPTRAGSERVKQKNTKKFANSNLLEIKINIIKSLLEEKLIDDIVLNSNCPASWEIAKKHDSRIHERDEYIASSECDIREYWKDAATHTDTDTMMLAQVTSPLISLETYRQCIHDYKQGDYDSLMTVRTLKEYLWRGWEGAAHAQNYNWPQHPKSQDLPDDLYYLTFGVCIIDREFLLKHGNLVGKKPLMYPLEGVETVDIDTEEDFKLAEELYNKANPIVDDSMIGVCGSSIFLP